MSEGKMKIGLVGYGLAGKHFHSPLFEAAGLELVAVNSRNAEKVHADFPDARVYSDLDTFLAQPDIELVVNASPSSEHSRIALRALAAGKHVINDKPFAATVEEADGLIEAAKAADRIVTCYQNRRWDADYRTICKLIGEGALGRVKSYRAHFDTWRPVASDRWRDQPGVATGLLADLGTHGIDQALTLFGLPEWIEAEVLLQRDEPTVSDGYSIRMGLGQLRIELNCTAFAADHSFRFQVHGTSGSFTKGTMDPQEQFTLHEGRDAMDPEFGIEQEAAWGTLTTPNADGGFDRKHVQSERGWWPGLYQNVRQAIRGEESLIVTPQQARLCIYVMEKAIEASAAQRRLPL